MLIIVIAKPIEFTIVKAVPFNFEGAFCATKVEKSGESAMTTMPQKRRKAINTTSDSTRKSSGEIRQQKQDNNNEMNATCLTPIFCAK